MKSAGLLVFYPLEKRGHIDCETIRVLRTTLGLVVEKYSLPRVKMTASYTSEPLVFWLESWLASHDCTKPGDGSSERCHCVDIVSSESDP